MRIEEEETTSYTALHVLNVLLLAGLWAATLYLYDRLPERIPGHVGPGGVTRWEPRDGGMWYLLPILGTGHALLMYVLAKAVAGSPGTVNSPQRKRLLALPREGQLYAIQPARGFMYGMAAWLLVLTVYMQLSMWQIAVAALEAEPATGHLIIGTLVLTLVPLALAYRLSRAMGSRIDAWERRTAAERSS